jgi:enoyl-CoA hydratase/carnithine racemase
MNVLVETNGPVTTVIINRPERRNAINEATAAELLEAFEAFEHDEGSAAAVLAGAGGCFCAGWDLKEFATEGFPESYDREGDGALGVSRRLLSKPVIAAVDGHAVAGGLELALWCDLRVMEDDATFGVFCRRWGVPLIDGGTVRLPRLIGASHALDMILTGRPVEADEALAWGLANRVGRPSWHVFRRCACGPTACPVMFSGAWIWLKPCATSRLKVNVHYVKKRSAEQVASKAGSGAKAPIKGSKFCMKINDMKASDPCKITALIPVVN